VNRRGFLGAAAMTLAAPQFAAAVPTSFGALKQIDAGLLNVGYVEAGPADGPPVVLLHDPISFRCDVAECATDI
jgi:hypothetical protein